MEAMENIEGGTMKATQKISVCLWFDSQAEEAAQFYVSTFKNARLGRIARYDEAVAKAAGRPVGSVLTVEFELDSQPFVALNGGPSFKFTEAMSLVVNCDTQVEVDHFWETLSAGGQQIQCGWLKDKYGVSWQIVPTVLTEMRHDKNPEKSKRVMAAMMTMKKLDVRALQNAYDGR